MKQRKGDVANGIQIAALPSGQQMGPQCREIQSTTSSREHKDTVRLLLPLLLPSSYQVGSFDGKMLTLQVLSPLQFNRLDPELPMNPELPVDPELLMEPEVPVNPELPVDQ
ncbi:unnamed protein product [Lampetra fluviatilis]